MGLNLLIPVSTFYDGCDTTCELNAGDHAFIRHLSYVFYAKAALYKAEQIDRGIDRKILIELPDVIEEVFQKVEDGICISPDTPAKVKVYFGC